ncbi:hypothetical protein KUTeg_022885 [Tegillarca granosa]|uniref:CS domain-containing protein n=1 Tax=Tegillarca granosa TaxID=220873 RepID=A0ABQ9E5V2_TEGGR|nr:hypothetical protein KUTeg_022885 [Tegillarca granosa]
MADSGEEIPTATTEETDLNFIRTTIIIPGLQTKKELLLVGTQKPDKNADIKTDFQCRSFEVTAEIKNKKGVVKKYRYKIKKLPGEIVPEKCKVEFKKELIICHLAKKEEESWAVQLSKSGLEQDMD